MNRPSLVTYLMGNPLSLIGSWIAVLYVGYHALIGDGSYLLALVMAMVAASTGNASDRITKYKRWQREWNGMAPDAAPRRPFRLLTFGLLTLFGPVGFLVRLIFRPQAKPLGAVKLCRSRVLLSPGIRQAFTALPEYCAGLIAPSGDDL